MHFSFLLWLFPQLHHLIIIIIIIIISSVLCPFFHACMGQTCPNYIAQVAECFNAFQFLLFSLYITPHSLIGSISRPTSVSVSTYYLTDVGKLQKQVLHQFT